MIVLLGILFLSILLYSISEYGVNMDIIKLDFILFILGSIFFLWNDIKKSQYFSFNSVFLVSYSIVTFFFPLFVYDTSIDLRMWSGKFVDYKYMTKAVSLSTISICLYFVVSSIVVRYYSYKKNNTFSLSPLNTFFLRINFLFFYITFFLLLINIIFLYLYSDTNGISLDANPFLVQVFMMMYIYSLSSNTINCVKRKSPLGGLSFISYNKKILFPTLFVVFAFLYVGDRGFPVSVVLATIAIYSYCCRQIKLKYIIALAAIGVVVLFSIAIARMPSSGALRDGDFLKIYQDVSSRLGDNSFMLLFSDLYGSFDTLCLSFEYHDKIGLYLPEYILLTPFIFIPLFPSLLSNLFFNKSFLDLSTGSLMNSYLSTAIEAHMGGQIIADLFVRWDVVGVYMFIIMFGVIISYFTSHRKKNIYFFSVFICFVSQSLYLPRSSVFDILRPIFLYAIWYAFLTHYSKKSLLGNKHGK